MNPIYVTGDVPRAYVRTRPDVAFEVRAFGPISITHPLIGQPCPACGQPFAEGDITTLVPLGPGDDEEERERARAKRWYSAVAIECHWSCVTGSEAA